MTEHNFTIKITVPEDHHSVTDPEWWAEVATNALLVDGAESAEFTLNPSSYDVEAAYQRCVKALPANTELKYVSRDDQSMDSQIRHAFTGEPYWLDADMEEWEADAEYAGYEALIADLDPVDIKILKDNDRLEELREEIVERDESDPYAQLVNLTPPKWMRYDLDVEVPMLAHAAEAEIKTTETEILTALGLGPEYLPTIQELLAEIVWSLTDLYVEWQGDIEPLVNAAAAEVGADKVQTITWTNPYLLAFNRMEGSGHMVDLHATITRPFTHANLRLDEGDGSWSTWVCGGLHDTLGTEVTITESMNPT